MIDFDVSKYLASLDGAIIDTKTDSSLTIYKLAVGAEQKIFGIVLNNSNPLQVTLKCDPRLTKKLRQEYETVMPPHNMNKNYWNTILCTGQLSNEDVKDLINLSYHLVKNS